MYKKDRNDLRQEMKKEEMKDRLIVHANEMFSKGFTNLAIRDEIAVYFPEITEDDVQRIRERWEMKQDVDKEMMEKTEEIFLPSQKDFVDYLRPNTEGFEGTLDRVFGKTKWRHWIRYDEGGFSFPSVEDWNMLKKVLDLDDTFDLTQTEQKSMSDETKLTKEDMEERIAGEGIDEDMWKEPSEKPIREEKKAVIEGKDIGKTPSLREEVRRELNREDQMHAEIVRATEELRRAITSEIRAQESYEGAKREMENAKDEMVRARAELDEFKKSVDLLKLKRQIAEREPPEDLKLETDTEEFKQFVKGASKRDFERVVEGIIDRKAAERRMKDITAEKSGELGGDPRLASEKVQEKVQERNGRIEDVVKDMYRNNLISIEKLAGYLGIGVEDAYKMGIERKSEMLEVEEKTAGDIEIIPDEHSMKRIAEMLGTDVEEARRWVEEKHSEMRKKDVKNEEASEKIKEQSDAEKFYDKVKRYLDLHSYLVVKNDRGKPEVYKLRLKLVGFVYGLLAGAPVWCFLLYVILMMAGVL